jgi:LPS-assembly lipoprotein
MRLQSIFVLLFIFLISGCGFHLKTNTGLADKYPQIYLQSNPGADITRLVLIRLRGAGIEVVKKPTRGVAILKINNEARSERTISLYVNATDAEKEIGYNLSYSIQNAGYQAQSFTFNIYRDFLDNPAQALAKSREAEQLTKELRVLAADQILYTLLNYDKDENKKIGKNQKEERSINGVQQTEQSHHEDSAAEVKTK